METSGFFHETVMQLSADSHVLEAGYEVTASK